MGPAEARAKAQAARTKAAYAKHQTGIKVERALLDARLNALKGEAEAEAAAAEASKRWRTPAQRLLQRTEADVNAHFSAQPGHVAAKLVRNAPQPACPRHVDGRRVVWTPLRPGPSPPSEAPCHGGAPGAGPSCTNSSSFKHDRPGVGGAPSRGVCRLDKWAEDYLSWSAGFRNALEKLSLKPGAEPDRRSKWLSGESLPDAERVCSGSSGTAASTASVLQLPSHWGPMTQREPFKKVELDPNSLEFQMVAMGFQNTASRYTIQTIERVQNLYLWQAYALCKQRILAKNGMGAVRELTLYHGASAEACYCIERTKFDRGFAGTRGSPRYGKGVYFAVDAVDCAQDYSSVDGAGLRRLFVARVLTGRHTVGDPYMHAPPPRSTADPADCFDSLVNSQWQPSMYVVFHDDQAYPEYLVTFR